MLAALNHLLDAVEEAAGHEVDVTAVAADHGTTEHHLRRMFSSLAGMPVSEYVRRRRMSLAAADLVQSSDDLLTIAVRQGYGSTEAFGRAFRAVHGIGLNDAREQGGRFRTQQLLRFRLTVEGSAPMHVRITDRPAFRLVGHATRVPLGVAVTEDTAVSDSLDCIAVPAGSWAVFTTGGPHPRALQETWAATAAEWFPSHAWRLRPGPSIVAVLEHNEDFTVAGCELWQPVEHP